MHDTRMRGTGPHTYQVFYSRHKGDNWNLNSILVRSFSWEAGGKVIRAARGFLDSEGMAGVQIMRVIPYKVLGETR